MTTDNSRSFYYKIQLLLYVVRGRDNSVMQALTAIYSKASTDLQCLFHMHLCHQLLSSMPLQQPEDGRKAREI